MGRLGEVLRDARLAKGASLPEVEQATHIREKILAALEEGEYSDLPAPVYLRGLARAYASYLKLDLAQISALLDQEIEFPQEAEIRPSVQPLQSPSAITGGVVILALAIICVGVLGWYLFTQYKSFAATMAALPSPATAVRTATATPARVRDTPAPATPALASVALAPTFTPTSTSTRVPTPAATATSVPTAAPSPTPEFGVIIEARFTKRCWIQVKVDGEIVTSETVPAGEVRAWKGHDSVWMHAGQPDGVEITFNGKYLGTLSSSGGTVKVEWTRP